MLFFKAIYIFLGTISLIIGIVGIFVPGLPTTPFLLLTAILYMKGSAKLYNKLINNKIIGRYIQNYYKNRGMTRYQKLISISVMWMMISISCLFFIEPLIIKIIIASAGLIGTTVILFFIPSAKIKNIDK